MVKNGMRSGRVRYRPSCKDCHSKSVMFRAKNSVARKLYVNEYNRRVGKVKKHPCLVCGFLCYKKYKDAFCSDKCRFLFFIDKQESCWIWKGALNRSGYGKFSMNSKTVVASRASYLLFNGDIADKKFICHMCDIPSCVNPSHLWVGSHVENMQDMVAKGRAASRLSVSDVLFIRELIENGCSNNEICEKFKISCGHVSNIVSKRIWKHV